MKTENNFKYEKMQQFTQFCNFKELQDKSTVLKIKAQVFKTGDVFLRFIQKKGEKGQKKKKNVNFQEKYRQKK